MISALRRALVLLCLVLGLGVIAGSVAHGEIVVGPAVMDDAAAGRGYVGWVTAEGGEAPHEFALTGGALPPGLTMGSDGRVSGTPTAPGVHLFTVTATDAVGATGEGVVTLAVVCPELMVTPGGTLMLERGAEWEQAFAVSGGTGPYAWAVSAGAWPDGVTFAAADATASGIPDTVGSGSVTLTVSDDHGCEASLTVPWEVRCPTFVIGPEVMSATLRMPFSAGLNVVGAKPPLIWEIAAGELPEGLSLDATSGVVSGVPQGSAGDRFLVVRVTDADLCEAETALQVTLVCPPLTLGPEVLPAVGLGVPYAATLTPDGGAGPWGFSVSDGDLPPGLVLDSETGEISGLSVAAGVRSFEVTATDADGCEARRRYTLTVDCPEITISPGAPVTFVRDEVTDLTFTASGGAGPWRWSVVSGNLPSGLVLDADNGRVTGLPDTAGTGWFVLRAVDVFGCRGEAELAFEVTCPPVTPGPASMTATRGAAFAGQLTADGAKLPLAWSLAPGAVLPLGLNLDEEGAVSGMPTALPGTYRVSVIVQDADRCVFGGEIAIVIGCPPLVVGPAVLPEAVAGRAWDVLLTAGGGEPPYLFEAATLPDGLTLAADGRLSGVPTAAGTHRFTVGATDAIGCAGSSELSLTVVPGTRLGNLVFVDLDADGRFTAGVDRGAAGVAVEAFRDSDLSGAIEPEEQATPVAATLTDAAGRWMTLPLAPGRYAVRIPAAAFASGSGVLAGLVGVPGQDEGVADDEDVGENGSDAPPVLNGVWSALIDVPTEPVAAGVADLTTIDFGFRGTAMLAGRVTWDRDGSGAASPGDPALNQVALRLRAVVGTGGEPVVRESVTAADGTWQVDAVAPGDHVVEVVLPPGCSGAWDRDGGIPGRMSVTVTGEGRDDLDAGLTLTPSGALYNVVDGCLATGGRVEVRPGSAVLMLLDGSTGEYAFHATSETSVTLTIHPPPGMRLEEDRPPVPGELDAAGAPHLLVPGSPVDADGCLGDASAAANPWHQAIRVPAGHQGFAWNNIPLRPEKARTWTEWVVLESPSGAAGPGDDPDGDGMPNLLEFAFCQEPARGIVTQQPLRVRSGPAGTVEAVVRRTAGAAGLTWRMEVIRDLAQAPAAWQEMAGPPEVTANGDGTETVIYRDLEGATGEGMGYVRLKVTLNEPAATAMTAVHGFHSLALPTGMTTAGFPLLQPDVLTGRVESFSGTLLFLPTAAGGVNLYTLLSAGSYYLEVIEGPPGRPEMVGHRFEIAETSCHIDRLALASDPLDTGATPADLVGARIAVRHHQTVDAMFPPAAFHAAENPAAADNLLFFRNGSFSRLFLLDTGSGRRWTDVADPFVNNQGRRAIPPGRGVFVHRRGGPETLTCVCTGQVRAHGFRDRTVAGLQLVAAPYPVVQSCAQRAWGAASGFTAGNDPALADRLLLWRGDATPGAGGYNSLFLLDFGENLTGWVVDGDPSVTDQSSAPLLLPERTVFVQRAVPGPLVLPVGWNPAP